MRKIFLLLTVALMATSLFAQQRYVDKIFSSVNRADTVPYGQNTTIITGAPMTQPLIMDVYTPDGDTATNRALVLVAHTGNFLPAIVNGSPNGTIKDSTIVEICLELAKRGYVAASFDYRGGWDPLNSNQGIQTRTLLQAAYRGVQDGRTCVRYFRRSVDEAINPLGLNPYGIDPNKIAMIGVGTGGYVSLGSAYLSDYDSEIKLFKFSDPITGAPYVDTTVHGNIYGTNTATLNMPNHVGYSSDISVVVNIGGACGDSVWVDANEPPSINFHTPQDPNAPYDIGVVIVPTTGNTVIPFAAGGAAVARINNRNGNNDVFKNAGLNDAYTQAANRTNNGWEGLMPFDRPFTSGIYDCNFGGVMLPLAREGSPWDWWNEANFIATWDAATGGMPQPGAVVNCDQRASNPDMSATKGRTYVDSIMNYMAPRFVIAMSLNPVSIDQLEAEAGLNMYPNPANNTLFVSAEANSPMQSIQVLDAMGRVVRNITGINASNYRMERETLPSGIYFVKVNFDAGSLSRRVIFE